MAAHKRDERDHSIVVGPIGIAFRYRRCCRYSRVISKTAIDTYGASVILSWALDCHPRDVAASGRVGHNGSAVVISPPVLLRSHSMRHAECRRLLV